MEETRKPVFLSHKKEDVALVETVGAFLEKNGIPCWYAPRDIPFGGDYNTEIPTVLKNVESVLVFITEKTGHSTGVPREVNIAVNNEKLVIPILIDDIPLPTNLEFFLCNTQWIDKRSYESDEEFLINLAGFLEELHQGKNFNHHIRSGLKQPVVLAGSSNSLLYELASTEIQKTEEVFVPPPDMEKALEKLKKERILHISNPHHIGKYSYAISLLKSAGVEEIFEWSKETSLRQITKEKLKDDSGFIAEVSGTVDFYAEVNENYLEEYIERLRKRNCYSIFIDKIEGSSLINPFSIIASPPQDLNALLINHIKKEFHQKDLQERILQWIQSESGQKLMPDQLYPRDVNTYIHKLKSLVNGEITEQDLVQSSEENIKKRIKSWFNQTLLQDNPIKGIAFYLSLTVHEGNTYSFIHEKARELYALIAEYENRDSETDQFFIERDKYLSTFGAHAVKETRQTDAGKEEFTAVRFIFKEDISYIWLYIWEQFPMFNSLLINWLKTQLYKNKKSADENIKNILSQLLSNDSSTIRTSVLTPLANSENPKDRLFAAAILEQYGMDEDKRYFVFNLVNSWARLNNNNRLQWTALVLIGTNLHLSYYPQSLRLLRMIYEKSEGKMAFSVQREFEKISRTALYSRDFESLYYRFWTDWLAASESDTEEVLKLILSIFAKFPEILYLSKTNEAHTFLFKLVHHSLKKSYTRSALEGALDSWARYSVTHSKYKKKLVYFLFEIYKFEDHKNKTYLENFINKRAKKNERVYLPIKQQLINM